MCEDVDKTKEQGSTVPLDYATAKTKVPHEAPEPIFYDTNSAVSWIYFAGWCAGGLLACESHQWTVGLIGLATGLVWAFDALRRRRQWYTIFKSAGLIVRRVRRIQRISNVDVECFRRRLQRFEIKLLNGKKTSIWYLNMSTPEVWRMEQLLRDRFKQCRR